MRARNSLFLFVGLGIMTLLTGCGGNKEAGGEVKSEETPKGAAVGKTMNATPSSGQANSQSVKPKAE